MSKLLPIETHMAYQLIQLGALTPVIVTTLTGHTILRVPLVKDEEYTKAMDQVKFQLSQDPFADLAKLEAIKKPTWKYDSSSRVLETMINYMMFKNMWLNLFGGWNLVYLEGADIKSGKIVLNKDAIDEWNDLRIIFRVNQGIVEFRHWQATCEPGKYYTQKPLNPKGAARIAFGQQRAWVVGTHGNHRALVQSSDILLYRDFNKDGIRTGDIVEMCGNCGINHHTVESNKIYDNVGKWSAGCLVGKDRSDHLSFIDTIKNDYRFFKGYKFVSTVLDPSKF
jgi:hypothetical protein